MRVPRERRLTLVCAAANPLGQADGDSLRVNGLLRALASAHSVRFIGVDSDVVGQGVQEYIDLLQGRLEVYPRGPASPSLLSKGRRWSQAAIERTPPRVFAHYVPAIAGRLEELAPRSDGIVLLDNAISAHWRSLRHACRTVIDVHHVAGWTLVHAAKSSPILSPIQRAREEVDARLMRSYERRVFTDIDGIVVTSGAEAARLHAMYGMSATAVVPSAVDLPTEPLRGRGTGAVGWLGHLSYPPNRTGLSQFVSESWEPLGRAGYRLLIAGGGASEDIRCLQRYPGVKVLGFVTDLPAFLSSIDVAVVPLWAGAGVKLKTVTFLAAGIPLAATEIALEGTSAVDGEHALIRDTAPGLALALRYLLESPEVADRVGLAGRNLAGKQLSWATAGPKFVAAVESVVCGRRTQRE